MAVDATNATSIKAVFTSDFQDKLADFDNSSTMNLTALAATSLEIVSDGAESVNA